MKKFLQYRNLCIIFSILMIVIVLLPCFCFQQTSYDKNGNIERNHVGTNGSIISFIQELDFYISTRYYLQNTTTYLTIPLIVVIGLFICGLISLINLYFRKFSMSVISELIYIAIMSWYKSTLLSSYEPPFIFYTEFQYPFYLALSFLILTFILSIPLLIKSLKEFPSVLNKFKAFLDSRHKPTKAERIAELEKQVAELKAKDNQNSNS